MFQSNIPLEDDACDIIAKAMHGLGISSKQLTSAAKISESDLHAALQGHYDNHSLKALANPLRLSSTALIGVSSYHPEVTKPDELIQIVSSFGHAGVNAYIIVKDKHAIVFDTGTEAAPIFEYLSKHQLILDALFITHRHHDHIGDIKSFDKIQIIYPEDVEHGQKTNIFSGEQLTALDVSGHTNPARAYCYNGLSSPVCIVGDSVFAGSMGKSPDNMSYQQALRTAQANLMPLSPDTIICPGHGPMTTIALEQANNPFLAATVQYDAKTS
jgi:hydroxyacylglutathione hydrolase